VAKYYPHHQANAKVNPEPESFLNQLNPKSQASNYKWFDRPFDKLTVLSNVEGLTTLSPVEG
jgi:hypothetical protein